MSASFFDYDVIVCGAGHAGVEAAHASARMGARTLLLSGNIDTIAQMSCNPAIGGVAKGQIVREIDALGGLMGICADHTGIHYRLLNATKGPAVQSPRIQCDKKAYQFRIKHLLEQTHNLTIFQATVTGLRYKGDEVYACQTNHDLEFRARAFILTTGTFLRGLMHIGKNKTEGGRLGDYSAKTLSASLIGAGIQMERLKTGTPPRLLGRSINFSVLDEQPSDPDPVLFGFYDTRENERMFHVEQSGEELQGWTPGTRLRSCWLTYTSERSGEIVRRHLHESALYSGEIQGVGPRYCPSIEDKFCRFADKERHLLFLEPEGLHTNEYYVNGLSTSLPFQVQLDLVRSIPGLEQVHLLRPAYAVEYDFAPPTQLEPSLRSKKVANLFLAGQINGTSGYEEAACQGLIAGANAVRHLREQPAWIPGRQDGYLGVLIDDLVTKGTREPYRMFTSRAEYRLLFNHGSAEFRLGEAAAGLGLISPERARRIRAKREKVEQWVRELESLRASGTTVAQLYRQERNEQHFPPAFHQEQIPVREEVLYRLFYAGYLQRELRQIERLQDVDKISIPAGFDFSRVGGLKKESLLKLQEIQPRTLGQASRISGVNPVDVSLLLVFLERHRGQREKADLSQRESFKNSAPE